MRHLLLLISALLLCQCVGPGGNPRPYSDRRELQRSQGREHESQKLRQAYERGLRDGRTAAAAHYNRNPQPPAGSSVPEINAYRDGYDQGYRPGAPSYPTVPGYPAARPSAPRSNDPVYSQGYDYGLRDRIARRQPDAGAYVGKYDPRYRRNFERGYHDAYEGRR